MENQTPVNNDYQKINNIGQHKSSGSNIVLVIFIMILVGGAAFAGVQIGRKDMVSGKVDMKVTEPEAETKDTGEGTESSRSLYAPTETVQPMPEIWESFTAPKTSTTQAFTIYYPKGWTLETQKSIKLSKGASYFEIWLGATSVGECLFDDDKKDAGATTEEENEESKLPETETKFPTFQEINKGQIMWRLAAADKPNSWDNTFYLCEKKPGDTYYHKDTSIGYVPFRVPQSETETINEILEILQKIEIN